MRLSTGLKDSHGSVSLITFHGRSSGNNLFKLSFGFSQHFFKYFYVLRPVLCCRWLEKYGTPAPVPFNELRKETLPQELVQTVDELLEYKRTTDEAERIAHIAAFDAFLISEIERIAKVMSGMRRITLPGYDQLNTILRETIQSAWNCESC